MNMPFGRYKGKPLTSVPDEYLDWLMSLDNLYEATARAIAAEWNRRREPKAPPPRGQPTAAVKDMAKQISTEGYRALTRKHHPDTGGSAEVMKTINLAMEWLRGRIV